MTLTPLFHKTHYKVAAYLTQQHQATFTQPHQSPPKTFLHLLYHPQDPILPENASFVIASLKLDFLQEIHWPGQVDIGTGILKIGNSSLVLWQQLFQHDICVARAETVIVQVDHLLKRSLPLSLHAQQRLSQWLILP